jgi:hypothetical protein
MKFITNDSKEIEEIQYNSTQFYFDNITKLNHYLYIPFNLEEIKDGGLIKLQYYVAKQLCQDIWFDIEHDERNAGFFIAYDSITGIIDFSNILVYTFRFQPNFEGLNNFDNLFYNNDAFKIRVTLKPIERLELSSCFIKKLLVS